MRGERRGARGEGEGKAHLQPPLIAEEVNLLPTCASLSRARRWWCRVRVGVGVSVGVGVGVSVGVGVGVSVGVGARPRGAGRW